MEEETIKENLKDEPSPKEQPKDYSLSVSIILAAIILSGSWLYTSKNGVPPESQKAELSSIEQDAVLPKDGFVIPIRFGDLGKKLVETGVIDQKKLDEIYSQRGGISAEGKKLLTSSDIQNIKISQENSSFILNLFWAVGLANKNPILDGGPMQDKDYGGAQNFASTGGWTLARGNSMDHYSRHRFFDLTTEQQALVEKVSKNIYRPCCDNSTYFPDCNHGMAMLGILELLASQGKTEQEMYAIALKVNSFWFPDTYLNIAKYLKSKGIKWSKANPKEILGPDFSSASGYQQILKLITPTDVGSGGGCSV